MGIDTHALWNCYRDNKDSKISIKWIDLNIFEFLKLYQGEILGFPLLFYMLCNFIFWILELF